MDSNEIGSLMKGLINPSKLRGLDVLPVQRGGEAGWMYERLVKEITEFESGLPDNMQAGGRLVSFQNTTFSISNVSYWGPDIIIFYGILDTGAQVELLQHISQLNLLLVAVPRTDDLSKPRRKIGF